MSLNQEQIARVVEEVVRKYRAQQAFSGQETTTTPSVISHSDGIFANIDDALNAAEIAQQQLEKNATHLRRLRDNLIKGVLNKVDEAYLNGHPKNRLPNNANIRFAFIEGESITLHLSLHGFLVATSSACTSKTLAPSHCLLSMGVSEAEAHGALQLTLGRENTLNQVDRFIEALPPIITKLRAMSPLSKDVPYDLFEDEEYDHEHSHEHD